MMSKEEVSQIAYCSENKISFKKRLSEHGQPPLHQIQYAMMTKEEIARVVAYFDENDVSNKQCVFRSISTQSEVIVTIRKNTY